MEKVEKARNKTKKEQKQYTEIVRLELNKEAITSNEFLENLVGKEDAVNYRLEREIYFTKTGKIILRVHRERDKRSKKYGIISIEWPYVASRLLHTFLTSKPLYLVIRGKEIAEILQEMLSAEDGDIRPQTLLSPMLRYKMEGAYEYSINIDELQGKYLSLKRLPPEDFKKFQVAYQNLPDEEAALYAFLRWDDLQPIQELLELSSKNPANELTIPEITEMLLQNFLSLRKTPEKFTTSLKRTINFFSLGVENKLPKRKRTSLEKVSLNLLKVMFIFETILPELLQNEIPDMKEEISEILKGTNFLASLFAKTKWEKLYEFIEKIETEAGTEELERFFRDVPFESIEASVLL